jgi:uncharacterized membrane protein
MRSHALSDDPHRGGVRLAIVDRKFAALFAVAVAVWAIGIVGRSLFDVLLHSTYLSIASPFGPHRSWQANLDIWVTNLGIMGGLIARGLLAILAASALGRAARRYGSQLLRG